MCPQVSTGSDGGRQEPDLGASPVTTQPGSLSAHQHGLRCTAGHYEGPAHTFWEGVTPGSAGPPLQSQTGVRVG